MRHPADNRDRIRLRLEQARLAKPAPQTAPQAPNPVPRINELASTGKTLWFGLLSYLAFVGVTLLGVTDADFFLVERKTQLPLINVSIPTLQFFTFAPLLGAVLYIYLHLHLLKLWEAVAFRRHAPEKLGRRPLSDHLSPWLVNDLALSLRADDALHRRPLNTWANAASILLVFIAPLVILAYFWWRSMPVHSGWLTIIASGLPLMASIYVGGVSWFRLRRLANPHRRLRRKQSQALQTLWALSLILVSAIGWFRTVEPFGTYADPIYAQWLDARDQGANLDAKGDQIRGDIRLFWDDTPFTLASADLANVAFVEKPNGWQEYQAARSTYRFKWCDQRNIPFGVCGPVPSTDTATPENQLALREDWCAKNLVNPQPGKDGCGAYFAEFEDQFRNDWRSDRDAALGALRERILTDWDMRGADLSGARLEGADLSQALLSGAVLLAARLEGADLIEARLEGAILWEAQLEGANLRAARLEGADLSAARLQGAFLWKAELQREDLSGAGLEGADLRGAQMEWAVLWFTRLEGANLSGARLQGANFWGAGFDAATDLTGTSFDAASVREVDFSLVSITPEQLNAMFGDGSVILPAGKGPSDPEWPDHWPRQALGEIEFTTQWREWQVSTLYTPPG